MNNGAHMYYWIHVFIFGGQIEITGIFCQLVKQNPHSPIPGNWADMGLEANTTWEIIHKQLWRLKGLSMQVFCSVAKDTSREWDQLWKTWIEAFLSETPGALLGAHRQTQGEENK